MFGRDDPLEIKLSAGLARESAVTSLKQHAERLRREAHGLDALAFQLSNNPMSQEADEALYRLIEFKR